LQTDDLFLTVFLPCDGFEEYAALPKYFSV